MNSLSNDDSNGLYYYVAIHSHQYGDSVILFTSTFSDLGSQMQDFDYTFELASALGFDFDSDKDEYINIQLMENQKILHCPLDEIFDLETDD